MTPGEPAVVDVAIVGAGVSGLVAASQLQEEGYNVVILEARERVGGRVHSIKRHGVIAELGAEMIHGKNGAVWDFIRKFSLSTVKGEYAVHLVEKGVLHEAGSPRVNLIRQLLEPLLAWDGEGDRSFLSALEQSNFDRGATCMAESMLMQLEGGGKDLSLKGLNSSYFYAEDYLISEGYQALCERLATGLEIRLGAEVRTVDWSNLSGCLVTCSDKSVHSARAVLLTLPIGVLKKGLVSFNPDLPLGKQEAISKIGIGEAVKLELWFHKRCWDKEGIFVTDGPLGTWWPRGDDPLISCFAGGRIGVELSVLSNEEKVSLALNEISNVIGAEIKSQFRDCSFYDWISDPYCQGAYSYNAVGMGNARQVLSSPLKNRLFFAGEACAENDHATVHGAIESGRKCAAEVAGVLEAESI